MVTKDNALCCQAIRTPTASPFGIVQLDYYDGTTEGLARCKVCERTYAFDVLASKDAVRMYGFAQVAPAYYEAVCALNAGASRAHIVEAEVLHPRVLAERNVFVLASNIEREVIASMCVSFETLAALVERP